MKFVLLSESYKTTDHEETIDKEPVHKQPMQQQKEQLQDEFKSAVRCGEGRLGDKHFFYRYFLRVHYVPYQEIVHAYLREESGESGEFLLKEFYLMLVFGNGQTGKLRFEREKNAREVISYLEGHYPDIKIGFYK